MRAVGFALVAVATLVAAGGARADTPMSRWEAAADPARKEDEKLHLSAERMLVQLDVARRLRSDLFDRFTRDLKTSLESWDAAHSRDPRLRFDYGELLEERGEHVLAIEVLKPALAFAPRHPAAENAWWFLGVACGHVGDYACEHDAYVALLGLRTEDYRRLTPMLNLAEVEMHMGRLKESISDYRETLRIAARLPTDETTPLAQWGLAVAYDRSGDGPAAEREATRAIELERSMHREGLIHSSGVFFFPDYEVYWYDALGAIARARAATSAHDAAIHWAEAERKFAGYVRGAEARRGGDAWIGMAKARHAACKAERERADRRRAKEPLPRHDEEDLPL